MNEAGQKAHLMESGSKLVPTPVDTIESIQITAEHIEGKNEPSALDKQNSVTS